MITGLIIVYLARVGYSLFNLMRAPLPHPADCILLAIFFYNAPLALIAFFGLDSRFPEYVIFLNAASRDPHLAQMTIICCFLATLATDIGRRLSFYSKIPQNYIRIDGKMLGASMSFLLSVCATAVAAAYSMGFSYYFAGYGEPTFAKDQTGLIALLYFCFEASGILFLFVFLSRNCGQKKLNVFILAFCISLLSAMALVRGKRLELVVGLLPILLIAWSMKFREISRRLIAVFAFIFSFSALASLRFGEIPTWSSLAFNSISEGLYAGHTTPGIINAIESQGLNMEWGARIYVGLIGIIPRFVFPQKDELVYRSLIDISEFAPLGATSLLAEVYLQGGYLFIFACFFVLGAVSRALSVEEIYDPESGYIPLKSLFYIIFVGTFLFHFRDGIIVTIKITIQMLLFLTVIRVVLAHQRFRSHTHKWGSQNA